MNLKKYVLVKNVQQTDEYGDTENVLKLKVINGFRRSEVEHALNVQSGWAPQGSDKLFFFPGCSVPRYKVREKFACTIKPSNATAAFISKNGLEGSDNTLTMHKAVATVDPEAFLYWLDNTYQDNTHLLLVSLLNNNNIEAIVLDENVWEQSKNANIWGGNTRLSDAVEDGGCDISKYRMRHVRTENANQLFAFNRKAADFAKMTCDIYLEEDVLKELNVGKITIGPTKYQELRLFGANGDKENLVLMMELMSNSDFEKSVVYLLFLLKEFGTNISALKESSHVNFKSLLSYLNINPKSIGTIGINDMTRILRDHNKFTRANALTVSMLFAGDSINYKDNNNVCWQEGPVLKADCETLLNDL